MERVKYLVVGAGVSGLSFANWVDSEDYLVCEASDEIGGYCKTIRRDGFVWDYSGHFFHFRRKEIEAYLIERMGDQRVLVVDKKSGIWFTGRGEGGATESRMVDFPFQKNIHQLPREDFIDCLHDLYFKEDRQAESFQEMLYAKFGRGIAEKFLIPYNEKLYATDLAKLDADAMGRFFPYANVDEIIKNFRSADNVSYNATFTYPEGGAIQYVEALASGVKRDQISLGERVLSIDLEKRIAKTNRREVGFEFLISSAPFDQLLTMASVPFDRDIYTYNKVLVFNLGFDRKGREGVHWVYFPQRDLSFYRVGYYDNIFGTDRMSLYVELGRPRDAVITEDDVARERERVVSDLAKAGVVDGHELVASHHVVLDPAYVHITKESVADVTRKKALLAARGVYSIGRYGSWTYCSIEDNIVEAQELAKTLSPLP